MVQEPKFTISDKKKSSNMVFFKSIVPKNGLLSTLRSFFFTLWLGQKWSMRGGRFFGPWGPTPNPPSAYVWIQGHPFIRGQLIFAWVVVSFENFDGGQIFSSLSHLLNRAFDEGVMNFGV